MQPRNNCGCLPYYNYRQVSVVLTNVKGCNLGQKKKMWSVIKRICGLQSWSEVAHSEAHFLAFVDIWKEYGRGMVRVLWTEEGMLLTWAHAAIHST